MPGKRQHEEAIPKIASRFSRDLRATSGEVIRKLSIDEKVPLRQVYEGHVYAAFDLLQAALGARHIYGGKMPKGLPQSTADRIRDRELLMHEIMDLIGDELASIDHRHEYSVLIAKREKGSPHIL